MERTRDGRHYLGLDTRPPRRPVDATPAELRFTPQRAVRWFSPSVLASAGGRVVLAATVGAFLDKRELQKSLDASADTDRAEAGQAWVDYIADTGDGFSATYTMAWLLAQPRLAVAGHDQPLPRADLLVLGGDEVYPVAGATQYEDRLQGPFEAAYPTAAATRPPPGMVAIPGNHDWYDGLTSFLRLFGQGRSIGGWTTAQRRSYFAVQLPHRWWLWGIDIQLDSYIDDPQLEFFESVIDEHMLAGDRLILATAVPAWVDTERDANANRNLAYLERKLIRPNGIDLVLTLAGDSHHYARYSEADGRTHKIIAGGGGAFLHPTHTLPRDVTVVVDPDEPVSSRSTFRLDTDTCYPPRPRSRLLALLAVLLPLRNPRFVLVPGVVQVLLLWSNHFGRRSLVAEQDPSLEAAAQDLGWREYISETFRTPTSIVTLLVLFGLLVAFAKSPPWAGGGWRKLTMKAVMGLSHLAGQFIAAMYVALIAIAALESVADGGWFTLWLTVVVGVVGGVAGSIVFGAYLAFWNAVPGLRAHSNEAFSAIRLTGYKNFLRLHIDPAGRLIVHAIGLRRVCPRRKWQADPAADDEESPWLTPPDGMIEPHLIERLVIPGGDAGQPQELASAGGR